jgi:O-acetyl-ADP-ribose deacetylase (regulator of RNase III)
MIYNEVKGDLFKDTEDYYYAHCISADFGMGAGIAVEFNRRFNMKNKLLKEYPNGWLFDGQYQLGTIVIDKVFNLVTKKRVYEKPTYESLRKSLVAMRDICLQDGIKKIAMPGIGCRLDQLEWDKVSEIIKDVFKNTDIEILVKYIYDSDLGR